MKCEKCGAQNKEGARFCTSCGSPLSENTNIQNQPGSQSGQQNWQQPGMPPSPVHPPVPPTMQTPKKGKGPLIAVIIILVLAICVVAAVIVSILVLSPLLYGKHTEVTQVVEEEHIQEQEEDTALDGDDAETAGTEEVPDVDCQALFMGQLSRDRDEKGNLIGTEVKLVINDTWETFDENGIFGAAIIDLNGDGQDELIEVYMLTETMDYRVSSVYADIYGVEDHEVVKLVDKLVLNDGIGFDDQDTCIYLKESGSGYYLVGDTYAMYHHWADGGNWQLYAYDCTDLAFDQIANFSMNGSAWDEDMPIKHINAGRAAGLNVTTGLSNTPMLMQDADVLMICNISNDVIQDFHAYYDDNYGLKTGMEYGTMSFENLTNQDYGPDASKTALFVENEEARYTKGNEDYLVPDSGNRIITREDLSEIADSADLLKKARNEIYARHGRKFKDAEIQAYFDSKDWYEGYIEPDDFQEDMLSEIEKANRDLIVEVEKEVN